MSAGNGAVWHRVLGPEGLAEGRVTTVAAGHRSIALTRHEGRYGALDNRCPHQGGPLCAGRLSGFVRSAGPGEYEYSRKGEILRCPWHGWDYCPTTGRAPGGHEDEGVATFPVEVREDGVWVAVPPEREHVRTVSDLMVETMVAWGVTHVFGMVGHSNLGLADAVRRQVEAGALTFVGVRHEGAASFAASAFAKLTGRPAACLSIAGPGATNLLTGLWDAKVDRAPILAMTGQVDLQVLGPGAFQEVDLRAAYGGVAAWGQTVHPESRHGELMALALKHAIVGRDVSHLVFPDGVQTRPADAPARGPEGRVGEAGIHPPDHALAQAAERLRAARRPVVIVGHGARFQMDAVMALAERLNAPVLTTFKGKGLVSDHHPLGCGVLGRSGTPIASWFMNEADLLLVMGASFSNHTGITPKLPIIQVDSDPMALGRFHPVAVPVQGDIAVTAGLLLDALDGAEPPEDRRPEIARRWAGWRAEKARRERDDRGRGLSAASVFAVMSRLVPEDAVIAVDVGNNTYSFGRYFECARQSVLMSGYLGSIGFGYPAAIGAWCAAPERPVVCVTGDGGFGQYMAELTTAVKYGMRIAHVLLDNGQLGKISKEQRAGQWDVWATDLHNPGWAEYAELCGALGIRVDRREDLEPAIARALAHDGPSLVQVVQDAELV